MNIKMIDISTKKPSNIGRYLCRVEPDGEWEILSYRVFGDGYFFIDDECEVIPVILWGELPSER